MIYVDPVQRWPTRIRCFQAGSCHLFADSLDELHAFAKRLGLRRAWFQDKDLPHYDLTVRVRQMAIELGAQALDRFQAVQKWKMIRGMPVGRF